MGFGLPAAIGAQLARPEARVVCVSGDGSIMMNLQELATLGRYDLPVAVVVLDNQCLGMVRQWQELFAEERYSEVDLSDNPAFATVAAAFGIPAVAWSVQKTSPASSPSSMRRQTRSFTSASRGRPTSGPSCPPGHPTNT